MTGALRTFEIALQVVTPDDDVDGLVERILARPQRGSGLMLLLLERWHVAAPGDRRAH